MIELFRNNLFFTSILLLPYCIVLRLKSILSPVAYQPTNSDGLFNAVLYSVLGTNGLIQNIVGIVWIFFMAVGVNFLSNKNYLDHNPSNFPGLVFILLTSYSIHFFGFSPALAGSGFVLIAMLNAFNTYKHPRCTPQIFNISFFITLAGMLYLPYLFLLPAGYFSLMILRSFKGRERLQYFSGFLSSSILIFSVLYLWGEPGIFFNEYIWAKVGISFDFSFFKGEGIYYLAVNSFLFLFVVINYNYYTMKKSIESQKKVDILYWFLFFCLPTVFVISAVNFSHLLILSLPLSFLLAMSLMRISRSYIAETIHLLILLIIFASQFGFWPI